jgi:heat shock protein HslJ
MGQLNNTAWLLTGLREAGSTTVPVPGSRLTAHFSDDQRIGGSSGCNTYFGGAAYPEGNDAGSFEVSQLLTTLMLCQLPAGVMSQEHRYTSGLRSADHFEIEGGTLTLSWNKGQSALILESLGCEDTSAVEQTDMADDAYSPQGCGCATLGYELEFVNVGPSPRAIAVTQDDQKVYVVCQDELRIIDVASLATSSLTTGERPMGLVMHPSEPLAYVANFWSRTITQYDTAAGAVLPAVLEIPVAAPVGKMQPASLAINPSGDKLFVNSSLWGAHGGMAWLDIGGGGAVHVVEAPTPSVYSFAGMSFTRSPYRAAVLWDGETFLALERYKGLRFVSTVTDSVIDYDIGMLGCTVLGTGGTILVSSYKTNGPEAEDPGVDIFRRDIAEVPFMRVRHIDTPSFAKQLPYFAGVPFEGFGFSLRAAAIEPSSGCLWYGNTDDGLAVGHVGIVDLVSGQFRTFAFEDCQGIAFTADGRYAFLSDTRNGRVARITLA